MHRLDGAGLRAVALLCGLTAALAGCRQGGASPPVEPAAHTRPRVLVLALDGLEPTLVDRFVASGSMPNVAGMIHHGVFATLDCVVTLSSPVVWTSVATGRRPSDHGIARFTADGSPVTSTLRRVPAFWNLLPRWELDPATIGWLATWPAEAHSGVMITERAWWGDFPDKVSPPGVIDVDHYRYSGVHRERPPFLERFTDYPFDPDYEKLERSSRAYAINFLLKRRLVNAYLHDAAMTEIAEDVAAHDDLDLLAVYLQGGDYTGHAFWQWFEPELFRKAGWDVPAREVAALGQVIPRYYQYLDELVGRLLALASPDALVIALSDHGFGPALGPYATHGDFLSGNHRPLATLVLSGPSVVTGAEADGRITHLDILPTVFWALRLPLSRELSGRPLWEFFTPEFRDTHVVQEVASYGAVEDGRYQVERSPQDEKILDELRSLGYIE